MQTLQLDITASASTPIYRQITEQIRRRVAGGQLRAGAALPSVRAVALQLAINPMTVSKAYSQLEAEGLLERRRGVGMVVAASVASASQRTRLQALQPHLERAAQAARQLDIAPQKALEAFERCLLALQPVEDLDGDC